MEISIPSLIILIIGIIVISFCIFCFLFCFVAEHGELNNSIDQRETNVDMISIGVNPIEIDEECIKRYKFKKDDKEFNCPYSLKKVEVNDDVIELLKCKHQFIVDEKKLSLKFIALNGCMICRDKSCIDKRLKGENNV